MLINGVYNDHEGKAWLDVKHKDFYTIASAVLTGMYDAQRIVDVNIEDIVSSKESIAKFLQSNSLANYTVNKVWNFLSSFMKKGLITVYRGFFFYSDDDIAELDKILKAHPRIEYNPALLLQYIDNTTKEFSSFSVDYDIAYEYCHPELVDEDGEDADESDAKFVLFSADVDNNDINWAFSAYLAGRHDMADFELNINNLKRLKNVKLLDYQL